MIIVSLTTLPSRIDKIEPVIESLLEQTKLPNRIIIYIPKYCKRMISLNYEIPKFLLDKIQSYPALLKIQEVDYDWGPITKIVPALKEFQNRDDIIISVDDDIILEKHFVEEFLLAHKEIPHSVLGYMGTNTPTYEFFHCELIQGHFKGKRLYKEISDGVLGGYRGILYPRKLITSNFFKYLEDIDGLHKDLPYPMLEDDLFISLALKKLGIPKNVIGTFYPGNLNSKNIYEIINIKHLNNSDGVNGKDSQNNLRKSAEIIKSYFNGM